MDPTNYGWLKEKNSKLLLPVSTTSDMKLAPPEAMEMMRCSCSSELSCGNGYCDCSTNQLSYMYNFCSCGLNTCQNKWTNEVDCQNEENEEEDVEDCDEA